ncbi:MAG: AI-2E family transporter [Thermoleophilaceae bacterium]|nr:AI-2E family transporter [Thermoleophilaceae bacterium]
MVRVVLIVVAVAVCLYLVYLVRRPITWILIAAFLAVALSGPVNRLARRVRRGLAIAVVLVGLLLVPVALVAVIVPPLITEANDFARNVPDYSRDLTDFVERNETLSKLNEDYNITQELQQEAEKLPSKLGGAATTLRDLGLGIVNSLFALITIFVLTAFMLGSGSRWVEAGLANLPPPRQARASRSLERIAAAISGYVAGAMFIAVVAGAATYVVLLILGVPFAAPLAVIAGFFSLIPLIGATIAAVLIGAVTLFDNFPTATIIWAVWAIVYQQFENHLIQPQVQKRTVHVHPFVTIVAVLMGSALLGVLGALLAIPLAASIQILVREYLDLRTLSIKPDPPPEPPEPPPAAGDPAPA